MHPCSLPRIEYEQCAVSAVNWYAQMVEIERDERRQHQVVKLILYKQKLKSNGKESDHEFIVMHGAAPTNVYPSAQRLLIERGQPQETSVSSTSSTSLDSSPVAEMDRVIQFWSDYTFFDLSALIKKRKARVVATYTPNGTPFSLFELSRLLRLLSEKGPAYELHHTHHDNCQWLAKSIVGVAMEKFHFLEDRSIPYSKRWLWGWLAGERNRKDPESDMRDIFARLLKEMRDNPDPIGEREAAKLEALRKKDEERDELERKKNEEIRKLQEKIAALTAQLHAVSYPSSAGQ